MAFGSMFEHLATNLINIRIVETFFHAVYPIILNCPATDIIMS